MTAHRPATISEPHPLPVTIDGRRWECDEIAPGSLHRAWRHKLADGRTVSLTGMHRRTSWRWRVELPRGPAGALHGRIERGDEREEIEDTVETAWPRIERALERAA